MAECPSLEEFSRFHDGALAEREEGPIWSHLATCSRCQRILEELSALDAFLQAGLPEEPASPCPKVLSRAKDHLLHLAGCFACRARLVGRRRPWLRRVAVAAAAALLATGLGVLLLGRSTQAPDPLAQAIPLEMPPDGPSAAGRLAFVVGDVALTPAASGREEKASGNDLLRPGDLLVTRSGQKAKLYLGSDGEVLVNENSRLALSCAGDGELRLAMEGGELLIASGRAFEISTPLGNARLMGGQLSVSTTPEGVSFAVLTGRAECWNESGRTPIELGQEVHLSKGAPFKARRQEKKPSLAWGEPMRRALYIDQFAGPGVSSLWKVIGRQHGSVTIADAHGRRALSVALPQRSQRGFAAAATSEKFPIADVLSLEVDFRLPRGAKGGRLQVTLISAGTRDGRDVLRWYLGSSEEGLEARDDRFGTNRPIWKVSDPGLDGEWHRVKLIVTRAEVTLLRDGRLMAHALHGLSDFQRVRVALGAMTTDETGETFEGQFSSVRVERDWP